MVAARAASHPRNPVAELTPHSDDSPEEAGVTQPPQLQQAGQEQLVLDDAVLDACGAREPSQLEGGGQILRDGLLAVDVLARGDRCAQGGCPLRRGLSVEIDVVVGAGQASGEIGGPPLELVLLGELAQLALVSADQDRLGPDDLTVADADAALLADGQDRSHQVLVGAHSAGDAGHDDSERHAGSLHLWVRGGRSQEGAKKAQPVDSDRILGLGQRTPDRCRPGYGLVLDRE